MSKHIFIACLGTETNSFSPIPTGLGLFERTMLIRNGDFPEKVNLFALPLITWKARAEKLGWSVTTGLAAFATPAGDTTKAAYEALRDEILSDLEAAMPVDAVLLSLHGAMVAEAYPDAEGDLLARIRARIGDAVPLLAELDLHGHQTKQKLAAADALVYFKEYPHIDAVERAEEVFTIAEGMLSGGVKPTMAMHDCRMLGIYPTTREPMSGFVTRMKALEQEPGILSVSLVHGFPWSNTPEIGTRVVVVTDNDLPLAQATAAELGQWVWEQRDALVAPFVSLDEALDTVEAAGEGTQPFVLADTADNTGIGAAGDSTFVLKRLLERNISGVAIAPLWDPVAVSLAADAGIGATLPMRIGGKLGPASGEPVDAQVTVMGLVQDARQPFGGSSARLGDMAWLRIENKNEYKNDSKNSGSSSGESSPGTGHSGPQVDVIINSSRVQAFHPDCFAAAGFDPLQARALVVKSTQHFHGGFAPIAREVIYMATPGCGTMHFGDIEHPLVTSALWPRVADPHQ